MLCILTDRGTEYCGKPDHHDYQLYLAINEIEHTKTKAQHLQTNGMCKRFHKTILNGFYRITFHKKIFNLWMNVKGEKSCVELNLKKIC